MATRYLGYTTPAAGNQIQSGRANIVAAASGGTLAGSQILQVVFDDTQFSAANGGDGKQRLAAAIRTLADFVDTARSWPIDSAS